MPQEAVNSALAAFSDGENAPDSGITTIKILQRKAIMLGDKRHLDAALEHINQAESNALKLLGYNDRMTLMIQNSKALCLKAKGRIGEAIHILESAYEVCRRSFGPDDPDYRRVASNLAAMIAPDDAERAWSISKSILESSERTYGPRHHLTTWAAYDLICQAERLGRWLEQRRIAVKYFAWLFRDQTRHQRNNAHMGLADELESQTRLQRNDTHTRFAHELEKGHSSIVGRYIEMRWHLFGMSAGRMPVEWYEAAITMEYMIRGSETLDTIEFQVLLSDYILRWRKQNSRRCSAICTRMIQRWKKDHTYMNPFHAKYNAKGVREIRALLKNIVRYERGVMPRWEQMSSMLRKNQDPSLAWRPREK